jgi:hypothetical protein
LEAGRHSTTKRPDGCIIGSHWPKKQYAIVALLAWNRVVLDRQLSRFDAQHPPQIMLSSTVLLFRWWLDGREARKSRKQFRSNDQNRLLLVILANLNRQPRYLATLLLLWTSDAPPIHIRSFSLLPIPLPRYGWPNRTLISLPHEPWYYSIAMRADTVH